MFEQATAQLAAGEAVTFRHARSHLLFRLLGALTFLSLGWVLVWLLYNDIVGPAPRYMDWPGLAVLFGIASVVVLAFCVCFLVKPPSYAVLTPAGVTYPHVGTVRLDNIHGVRYAQEKNGATSDDLIALDIDLEGQHELGERGEHEKARKPLASSEQSDSVLIFDCLDWKQAEQFLAVLQWAHEQFTRQDSHAQ